MCHRDVCLSAFICVYRINFVVVVVVSAGGQMLNFPYIISPWLSGKRLFVKNMAKKCPKFF